MEISNQLVKAFSDLVNEKEDKKESIYAYGVVKKDGQKMYVMIDGSSINTPVRSTSDANDGDRVLVMVKNHEAIIMGNETSPAARTDDVKENTKKVTEFEDLVADKVVADDIEAYNAWFESLIGITGQFEDLSAFTARIEELKAKYASLEHVTATDLEAMNAEIESLKAEFGSFEELSAEQIEAGNGIFDDIEAHNGHFTAVSADELKAQKAYIDELEAKMITAETVRAIIGEFQFLNVTEADIRYASIEALNAQNAVIDDLRAKIITTDMLDAEYARLDKANITTGWVDRAMIGEGVVGTLQIEDGSITDAKIVGLTASKITAGVLDAGTIDVINLNAENITVGTINGKQIAPGAIDFDNLSDSVSDTINDAKTDAQSALTEASTAKETASTAQKTADGKNTIYYQTSAPSGTDHKINDAWFDTDDANKMYSWDGSKWVVKTFGNAAIANLDAGKITTGTLAAARIGAHSISVNKLAVTDSMNYCQLTEYNCADYGFTVTKDADGDIFTIKTITRDAPISEYIPCRGGEELWIKGSIASSAHGTSEITNSAGYLNVRIGVYSYDASNKAINSWQFTSSVTSSATAAWGDITPVKIKLPDNARRFRINIQVRAKQGTAVTGSYKIRNITVNRMASGELIVDGSITAGKVAANAITAGKIAANAVTTANIQSGAINADKIAANAITAGKIAANAVTTDNIVASAVTGAKIAANTITANNILSSTITADKLNVASLSAITADLGTVTAGIIQSKDFKFSNYEGTETGATGSVLSGLRLDLNAKAYYTPQIKMVDDHIDVTGYLTVGYRSDGQPAGFGSIVHGWNAAASAAYSHAQGPGCSAHGIGSHAEGYYSNAINDESHAEGYNGSASGRGAHAEGYKASANGDYSHAEGWTTTSGKDYSHAEGYDTEANADSAHAEGHSTSATGNYSHSEGDSTSAMQIGSHTEGQFTNALGMFSHAEGGSTTAMGAESHAEGISTKATGLASHSEGNLSEAIGDYAHAEGVSTKASGQSAHSQGRGTLASSADQSVIGKFNIEDKTDKFAYIIGGGTNDKDRKNIFTVDWAGNVTGKSFNGTINDPAITAAIEEISKNKLIEYSSNSNGHWFRWDNGIQICYLIDKVTNFGMQSTYGPNLFSGQFTWTYPKAFSTTPVVFAPRVRYSTGASWANALATNSTSANIVALDVAKRTPGKEVGRQLFAFGLWKNVEL